MLPLGKCDVDTSSFASDFEDWLANLMQARGRGPSKEGDSAQSGLLERPSLPMATGGLQKKAKCIYIYIYNIYIYILTPRTFCNTSQSNIQANAKTKRNVSCRLTGANISLESIP